MRSCPMSSVAFLDLKVVTAILQSIAQSVANRRVAMFLALYPQETFCNMTWKELGWGLDHNMLCEVILQANAMFHTTVAVPEITEVCGTLAQSLFVQWEKGERTITFFTSGSTGIPTPCTHGEHHLRQEITSVAPLVDESIASALVTVPLHHLYGFTFGVLLPLSLGIPIRYVPPLPTAVSAQMHSGDMVVGIPLVWQKIVELQDWKSGSSTRGNGITAFTSTSPTPPEVLHALVHHSFRTVEIFGSSEVGAICSRLHPDGDFELLPHLIRGKDNNYFLERLMPEGETRRYPIMDDITWLDDRHLRPGGRLDRAVQVGGINVYPQHVAHVLEQCEGVQHCVVRLMRADEGHRLKAFVVPDQDADQALLQSTLMRHAHAHLRDEERPGKYDFGTALPRSRMGKLTDW